MSQGSQLAQSSAVVARLSVALHSQALRANWHGKGSWPLSSPACEYSKRLLLTISQSHWSLPHSGIMPKKFDFVHQTVSPREAEGVWSGHETSFRCSQNDGFVEHDPVCACAARGRLSNCLVCSCSFNFKFCYNRPMT